MKQYSCPICDKTMKGQHYCSFCRQFVKNAYVSNAKFYLNERHPEAERDCTYHNADQHPEKIKPAPPAGRSQPGTGYTDRKNYRPQAADRAQAQQRLRTEHQIQAEAQKPIGQFRINLPENDKKTNSGVAAIGWVIMLIVFMINILGSCSS